jgi:hypothetical protein
MREEKREGSGRDDRKREDEERESVWERESEDSGRGKGGERERESCIVRNRKEERMGKKGRIETMI